ncbi:hypothetical protein N0V93_004600 [Gnomoniopsis smithogilvyi]|uniref:Rhodopsin domain-containing protein n=1 Tax=Gnomoniopsis smithogilvyi TaxID=1191159 RepID=A0A9W8YRD1_9PEZI|nr:hypothetical protein N0V93_004600 [Gnomoniopsis smithogilvyi]
MWMIKTGLVGRHIWDTPLGVVLIKLPYWTVIVAALPQPITGLVKAALLLFYLRVFRPNVLVRYGSVLGIVMVAGMYIAWMFVFIFQTAFENAVGTHLSWAQAAFNLATDVYIFCLPIYGIVRLQMSTKRRFGIITIFATALAAIVMSAVTLNSRVEYNGNSPDPTWSATARITLTFSSFTTLFKSLRTRFLGSMQSAEKSNKDMPRSYYGNKSDVELVQKKAVYIDLQNVKQAHAGGREWFDDTGDLTQETVYDRTSMIVDKAIRSADDT